MLESFDFLRKSAPKAAERLLGCQLEAEVNGQRAAVRIVETEAYDQTDAASHSYNGRTKRTDIMFAPAGHLYVYISPMECIIAAILSLAKKDTGRQF